MSAPLKATIKQVESVDIDIRVTKNSVMICQGKETIVLNKKHIAEFRQELLEEEFTFNKANT